jgi:hypothetical protein
MPRPRTVSLLSNEDRKRYNRGVAKKYDELASFGYYTDEELIKIRGEIWREVFEDMAVEMGINEFSPNTMTQSDLFRLLATLMEKR